MAADLDQSIALAPPDRARILRAMWHSSLADAGQIDRAAQAAEPLVADARLNGALAFDLATIFFRAAAPKKGPPSKSSPDEAQRRTDQGLKLLQRAADAGFFKDPANRQKLHGPPFLPLLAQNAAFAKLLEAVEKAPRRPGFRPVQITPPTGTSGPRRRPDHQGSVWPKSRIFAVRRHGRSPRLYWV